MTKDNIPLVVSTSRPFFIHDNTVFVTRVTQRTPLLEQELLTLPEHPCYKWDSCYLISCLLFSLLEIIFCPLVLFLNCHSISQIWYSCHARWTASSWYQKVAGQIGPKSNRPQVKSAPCYIYKIKWKYRYLTLFFLPNATCLLEKQKYQFLQSLVWHIISYCSCGTVTLYGPFVFSLRYLKKTQKDHKELRFRS